MCVSLLDTFPGKYTKLSNVLRYSVGTERVSMRSLKILTYLCAADLSRAPDMLDLSRVLHAQVGVQSISSSTTTLEKHDMPVLYWIDRISCISLRVSCPSESKPRLNSYHNYSRATLGIVLLF